MRVVLDSNVWLAAVLFPGRVCDQLLACLRAGRAQLVVSPPLLDEVARVLRRKFDFGVEEAQAVLKEMRSMAHVIEPTMHVGAVAHDEADNRVLECALAARADLIVTGDTKHLLPLKQFQGIPIRSPGDVLSRLIWTEGS